MRAFTPWTQDDAGDLVNLALMECITIAPLEEDQRKELKEQFPSVDCTHELLAIAPDQRSYRLGFGSEAKVKEARDRLAVMLLHKD